MVFQRFFSFTFGVITGVYVAQNYNDIPNVKQLGNYYYNKIKQLEETRRKESEDCEDR